MVVDGPVEPLRTSGTFLEFTARRGSYWLEGTVIGVSDPGTTRLGRGHRGAEGHSVVVWIVERGVIGAVEISGLAIAVVSWWTTGVGDVERLLLVDERGTPEQVVGLLDLFQDRVGGPLSTVASPADRQLSVYLVPIGWNLEDGPVGVEVPGHLEVHMLRGSCHMTVNIPEYGLVWRGRQCDGMQAEIRLVGAPAGNGDHGSSVARREPRR